MEEAQGLRPEITKSFFLMDAAAHSTEAEAERAARSRVPPEGRKRKAEQWSAERRRRAYMRKPPTTGRTQMVTVTKKEKGQGHRRWPRQGRSRCLLLPATW